MIGYLRGIVREEMERGVLVDVGGVGYDLNIPERSRMCAKIGEEAEYYVYTHVREDVLQLFGFDTLMEKKLFLMLISVNGIGPKSGMDILAEDPAYIINALAAGDSAAMTKLPGIGKKTAERLVLDLQEKVLTLADKIIVAKKSLPASSHDQDVIDALSSLGYDAKYAQEVLHRIQQDVDTTVMKPEDVVKLSLRYL